jgi:hypothetical protein
MACVVTPASGKKHDFPTALIMVMQDNDVQDETVQASLPVLAICITGLHVSLTNDIRTSRLI